MTARTATQALAEIRLILGDAAEPLLQVIRSELAQGAKARAVLDRIAIQAGRRGWGELQRGSNGPWRRCADPGPGGE